jgi:hypothetical protein
MLITMMTLKRAAILTSLIFLFGASPATQPDDPSNTTGGTTETVIIIRHGEKARDGSGQLSPRGFNRALALSTVLPERYGHPAAMFAPDPYEKISDGADLNNYVRPLATIEPTAIRLGMAVQTPCGFRDDGVLTEEITRPVYANSIVFVAWEHNYGNVIATDLVKKFGGDIKTVPAWTGNDYDSIYVVKITRTPGAAATVSFRHDHENLDRESDEMPSPPPAQQATP